MKTDLGKTFQQIKKLFTKYEPKLKVRTNKKDRYELEFDKQYATKSLKTGKTTIKDGLYFAGIIIQKNYVGLYFMPIYSHKSKFKDLSKDFMKKLKGKSCFHIKELDRSTKQQAASMIKTGYDLYKTFEG